MLKSYLKKGGKYMKKLSVNSNQNEKLCISIYGYQNLPQITPRIKGYRNAFILHYIFSGEGYFCGKFVKSGEGFLITPKQTFEFYSSSHNPWCYFWVTFSGSEADKICQKYIKQNSDGIFKFNFLSKLHDLIDMIFTNENFLSPAMALGYFFLLMAYHENSEKESINNYIYEAKNYMKANMHRNLSITEIADALSISDRYLYNLFIKHEKKSPKQYLNNLKISYAKSLLKNTACTITEIAVSLGFSDVLSFSHFFKKNTGISPSDYRNKRLLL